MCGVVGVVDLARKGRVPNRELFARMVDQLERRGPDGRGEWHARDVAFGHRRLAVIDPRPVGKQPMVHPSGVVLTYNGEVYNFRELREQLSARGHRFDSDSDSEVVLAAVVEWGAGAAERLEGIYAFAAFDPREHTLLLCRDHLGVKPLFVHERDGVVHFASELDALLLNPDFPRRLSARAVESFLTHCYVAAPFTPFDGVEQVAPGETRVYKSGGLARYRWRASVDEREMSETDAVEALSAHLKRAVHSQMVSDVPLGAFLSGGLDSAAVTHAMRERSEVNTFSIGFSDAPSFDESTAARESAALIGTHHRDRILDLDLVDAFERIADTNADLLADASGIAVDALCRFTKSHVTVALSGDGADELLAGYPTYLAGYYARALRRVPRPLRRVMRAAIERAPAGTERYTTREFALRFLRGSDAGRYRDHASWRRYFWEDERDVLTPEWQTACARFDSTADYARWLAIPERATLLKRMLFADVNYYLPSDMLAKVDRASMRHGLEVRVPFMDRALVEFALSVPTRHILGREVRKKHLLKRHLEDVGLSAITQRKKRGFNVPVAEALRHELGAHARALFEQLGHVDSPLDERRCLALLEAHREGRTQAGERLYLLMVLAAFCVRFKPRCEVWPNAA